MHIHQALVGLMAVNMFPFCDKSGHRAIYAAVGREPELSGTVKDLIRLMLKLKPRLNRAGVERKFIVVSYRFPAPNCHCHRCGGRDAFRIAPAFNNGWVAYRIC